MELVGRQGRSVGCEIGGPFVHAIENADAALRRGTRVFFAADRLELELGQGGVETLEYFLDGRLALPKFVQCCRPWTNDAGSARPGGCYGRRTLQREVLLKQRQILGELVAHPLPVHAATVGDPSSPPVAMGAVVVPEQRWSR
jgi:hypothetical protein